MNFLLRSSALRARWLVVLCAAAVLCTQTQAPALAEQRLPALGDAVSDEFDVGVERRLGERVMQDIRRDPDYLDDPVLLDYLQSLWQPLVAAARARGEIGADIDTRFAWESFLVRDRSVNAFALPGGFVGVHLGLIGMTATRDELASVLAHELSHVSQRHIARSIGSQRRQSVVSMAAMILGVLAAAKSNRPDGANAVIAGSQALAIQGQLNFSRDMEREADRIGFFLLSSAGFAPGGMAAMFEKLDHNSRLTDSGGFPYLRSHPLTTERIGEARSRLGVAPPPLPTGPLVHTLAQARARVLMDTRAVALQRWQTAPDAATSVTEQLLAASADALASSLLREWPRADDALQRAQRLVASAAKPGAATLAAERVLALQAAELMLARGQPARAAALLQPWAVANGAARPVMLLMAQVAEAEPGNTAALQRSAETLQTWVSLRPADAAVWSALGRNWALQGHALRALRAEAEARVALGDFTGGVDRLRAGQRLARSSRTVDFIEASVIETRLRDVEVLRRQQALPQPDI